MWKWMIPVASLVAGLAIVSGCATAPTSTEGKAALDDFKNGSLKFAAQASATALKVGTSENAESLRG